MVQQTDRAFSGRRRKRKTRGSVKVVDKVSRLVITIGGIGTIVAVLFILFFLIAVVLPLFGGAEVENAGSVRVSEDSGLLRIAVDDFRIVSWELRASGSILVRRLDTGEVIERHTVFPPGEVTALSSPKRDAEKGDVLAIGTRSGAVILGKIAFETTFHESTDADVPEAIRALPMGEVATWDGGMVQRTPVGQLRRQKLLLELDDPIALDPSSPVVALDRTERRKGPGFSVLTEDGRLRYREIRLTTNRMTGKVRRKVRGAEIPFAPPATKGLPRHLILNGGAHHVFLIWEDGHLVRQNISDLTQPREAEVRDVLPEDGATITAITAVIGKETIVVGDSLGRLRTWWIANSPTDETVDGKVLVQGHDLEADGVVRALFPSPRSRTIAAGLEDGRIRLFFVSSQKLLGEVRVDPPIERLTLAPRDDGLLAVAGGRFERWTLEPGHPEATLGSLFGSVRYEGYTEPQQTWQSSGGSDEVEMKLGLMPLVFGTLKATLFSMLFAVPLALLAAIYTSEFLSPKVRPRVKAVVEVMASLPSVVLGFLAAFVMAPFVEDVVPTILIAFITLPFTFVLGANLWQLLPRPVTLGLERFRLGYVALVLPIGIVLAVLLGPLAERIFFSGDVKAWLDGQVGSGAGGWALVLLPVGGLVAVLAYNAVFGRMVRGLSEAGAAVYSIVRLVVTATLALIVAGLFAAGLEALGVDPRGGLLGTYVQRNALVVGFAMGFAVIPIIYTIAEDALTAVPDHLRAASLGAGATPWQTAIRVIVPTAASGLFSACMIGLGRAVGETMIVLMAAGNTPIMEWNPFNGFQTLSAAIATEMPEAVKDSTHYRVLFLSGLVLFAMTFVVNTIAEAVRLRFRRRAFQL